MFSWGELFSTFMARKIMGMRGTCRSANRGGCPFLYALSAYSKGASVLPAFILFGRQFSAYRGKTGQKGAKVIFYLVCFGVFSGIWDTERGKNLIYFWNVGAKWVRVVALLA